MSARLVIALAMLAASTSSHALYANVTPPGGFSFTGGALKYGGTPAATLPWVSGASGISTSTSFIGRNFIVPGTARLAPGAGQAVARAILTNPAMRIGPMMVWAAAGMLVYDVATGLWNRQIPNTGMSWHVDQTTISYASSQAACEGAAAASLAGSQYTNLVVTVTPANATQHWCSMSYTLSGNNYTGTDFTLARGTNTCPSGDCPPTLVPATQTDFDTLAETHPMPDAVAQAADDIMPLPVALPELQPLVQPIGQPRETPEGTVQDRVRITPANDEEAPWRVEETVETVPEGTDEETEGEDKPVDPCDAHPERVGCQTLEAPDDPGITPTTHTIAYEAENLGFGSGCPAPRTFTFHGWALPLDYTPVCNVAPTIRMGLIAITALGCILIIIGVTRS